jgi:signal transduction histidine kinase
MPRYGTMPASRSGFPFAQGPQHRTARKSVMQHDDLFSPDAAKLEQRGSDFHGVLALLALPVAWSGCEPPETLEMLLETLETILPINLGYALAESPNGRVELLRVAGAPANHRLDDLRAPLGGCIWRGDLATQTLEDRELGRLGVAVSPFDLRAWRGALVFGSPLLDFPDETEMSIVRAATELVAEGLATADALREREAVARAREEFLATVVHEMRHPLGPIVMALDLLKARSGTTPSNEIAVIERHVEHLSRLIDDLSNLSRVTRGELEVKKQAIELIDAITDGIEEARPLVRERGHDLRLNVPARGLRVFADRTRMAQVVANLVTNAAKYTEPGGSIELSAWREEELVLLRVRDDGIGIAAELLPHVFDRFVRGRPHAGSGFPAQSGLGIGLAVVKHLVSLHGGTVAAWSDGIGKGSEFTVRLPALDKSSGTHRLSFPG